MESGERRITPEELKALNSDPEFRTAFESDPELNRLEQLKYDERAEFLLFAGILHYHFAIGKIPIGVLTPAKWSFLYFAENAYTRRNASAGIADMDLFLYILSHSLQNLTCALHEIPAKASGYTAASGLSPEEVHEGILRIIRGAFLPLEMLPQQPGKNDEDVRYDGEWLVRIASLAARESGCSIEYCKLTMSLGEICTIFVDHQRRNADPDYAIQIRRRSDMETSRKIMKRTRDLQIEFLSKKERT